MICLFKVNELVSGTSAQFSKLLFGPSLMEATSRDYHSLDGTLFLTLSGLFVFTLPII